MMPDPTNLLIAGVGGQGNVFASAVLGQAAVKAGLYVAIGETYGASQRGGSVTSHVRFSPTFQPGPLIPRGQAHVILGLELMEALRVAREYASVDCRILVHARIIPPLDVLRGVVQSPSEAEILEALSAIATRMEIVDFQSAVLEAGESIVLNAAMLGAISRLGWLPVNGCLLRSTLGAHGPTSKRNLSLGLFDIGARDP